MAISAAKLMVEVGADTREAEAGLKGFSGKLNNAAKSLTKMGGMLSLGITTPLLGVATAGVNLAADFEQSMNILQQVVGATESDMASLQQQALQLGADTVFSAGEAAEGMLELGKAGMDSAQIMAAIPGVMDLAAAAGTSLGQAAGITAAALNAFGLEASESARVADMLAAGANASAADITDLAQGLQQAGFAFDMANQPIESLVASLALLTNVGLTGSDAGTALKNAFMRMMNPTNEALELMKELNISFYDAQGNMMQLPAIIDNLNAALSGLTPQQRDAALATIFLSDGMKAMVPLLDAGSAGFNAMVAEVTQVGAATETANARMGGLSGGIEQLRGAVESFMIGAALPFLDTLGGLARGAADAITSFGELPQPIINASLAFAGVLAAAGPLMVALGGLAAAFAFLLTPVGAVVAAAAGLAAAWAADVGGIQAITGQVAAQVQQGFSQMLASAQQLASGIQTAFSKTTFPSFDELFAQFKAGDFQTVANTIRDTAYELMVNLNTELNITGQADKLRGQLAGLVNSISTAVGELDFSAAQANLSGLRDGILSGLTTAIDGVDWGQGGATFAGMISNLSATVRNLDLSGIDWAAFFQRALLGPMGTAVAGIQWVMDSSNFAGLVTSVQTAFSEINWGDIGAALTGLGTAVRTQLGLVFADMMSDVGTALPDVQFNLSGMVNAMATAINNQDWSAVGSNLVSGLRSGIDTVMSADVTWAQNFANTFAASVRGAFASIEWGDLNAAFANLGTAVRDAIYALVGGIGSELNISIPDINWDSIMEAFSWSDWMTQIQWSAWIPSFGWGDYIASIEWSSFVPTIAWSSFVPSINWGSYVSSITWDSFIPDFNWSSFVPTIDWGRFIPFLNLGGGGGSSTPAPSGGGGGGGGGFGGGGGSAPVAVGVNGITVNVANVNTPMDVHSMASTLAREFRRRVR